MSSEWTGRRSASGSVRAMGSERAATEPQGAAAPGIEVLPTPEAVEFVRYCYQRSGVIWPELYDEMCAVAARNDFRGLDYEELAEYGISFGLSELPRLSAIAQQVVSEERAARPMLRALAS